MLVVILMIYLSISGFFLLSGILEFPELDKELAIKVPNPTTRIIVTNIAAILFIISTLIWPIMVIFTISNNKNSSSNV